jgi:hypothetical protein
MMLVLLLSTVLWCAVLMKSEVLHSSFLSDKSSQEVMQVQARLLLPPCSPIKNLGASHSSILIMQGTITATQDVSSFCSSAATLPQDSLSCSAYRTTEAN